MKSKHLITLIFVIAIIIYTYPLIGLWGQVKATSYPESYFLANDYLKTKNITGYIIYLPWQTYLTYNWTLNVSSDGRIANPINKLIEPIVLTGPDEYGGESELQNRIKDCLDNEDISCLEANSVQFILKDRCTFYPEYTWINRSGYRTSCIDIIELYPEKPAPKQAIPARFIIGSAVSLMTLLFLIYFLIKK